MDIEKYFARINYNESVDISSNTLSTLQKNHLLNIPFENLDIHLGKTISLALADVYKKIVTDKRGGFCYELNSLFNSLLQRLGFTTQLISARVYQKNGEYSPEFDHLAIIVAIEDEKYLVDVGFGSFSLEPLKIEMDKTIIDRFGQFIFDKYDSDFFRISKIENEELIPQYIFKMKAHNLSDFAERSHFHQTNSESHFAKKKLISIAKENGRITLAGDELKKIVNDTETVIHFEEKQFPFKLKDFFNIEIKDWMSQAVMANLFEFYKLVGTGKKALFEAEEFKYIKSPEEDWPNLIFALNDPEFNAQEMYEKVVQKQLPNLISLLENKIIDDKLIKAGFKLKSTVVGMYLNLKEADKPKIDFSSIEIVDNTEKAAAFVKITTASFKSKIHASTIIALINCENLKMFIGKHENEFVSTGMLILDENGISGLHMISTSPEHRGMGLGKIMTNRLLFEAYENKSEQATLVASKAGELIYSKLGFIWCGNMNSYLID